MVVGGRIVVSADVLTEILFVIDAFANYTHKHTARTHTHAHTRTQHTHTLKQHVQSLLPETKEGGEVQPKRKEEEHFIWDHKTVVCT